MNIPERRKAQQFSIRVLVTVKYTRDGHYEFTGVSRDLSASGMFLQTDSNIEQGCRTSSVLPYQRQSEFPTDVTSSSSPFLA